MKKTLLCLLVGAIFSISSCSKSSNGTNVNPAPTGAAEIFKSSADALTYYPQAGIILYKGNNYSVTFIGPVTNECCGQTTQAVELMSYSAGSCSGTFTNGPGSETITFSPFSSGFNGQQYTLTN